jgi:hypothetical protein
LQKAAAADIHDLCRIPDVYHERSGFFRRKASWTKGGSTAAIKAAQSALAGNSAYKAGIDARRIALTPRQGRASRPRTLGDLQNSTAASGLLPASLPLAILSALSFDMRLMA